VFRVGLGQDSHAFEPDGSEKPLILGGVLFPDMPGSWQTPMATLCCMPCSMPSRKPSVSGRWASTPIHFANKVSWIVDNMFE